MAVDRVTWEQAVTDYTADEFRNLIDALFPLGGPIPSNPNNAGGVGRTACHVHATGGMTVQVYPGYCVVPAKSEASKYLVRLRSGENVTLAAADSQPRIDLICLQVSDTAFGDSTNGADVVAVKGTAASSPSAPATPSGAFALAHVAVGASAASIDEDSVTDVRGGGSQPGLMLLDPVIYTNYSDPDWWPQGLSLLRLTTADAADGGWPMDLTSQHVLTIKSGFDRVFQFALRNSTTEPQGWFRTGNTDWSRWLPFAPSLQLQNYSGTDASDKGLPALKANQLTLTGNATAVRNKAVTFAAPYASYPVVWLTLVTAVDDSSVIVNLWAGSITPNGFIAHGTRNSTVDMDVQFVAIGAM